MTSKSLLRLSVAACALTFSARVATAQTAGPLAETAAATQPAASGVAEVIVTATKRAENVQSVPQSVLAVTKVTLDRANVRDFDDLTSVAPDLTITKTTQPFNNSINIRGIGTYAFSIATEASTAVVVDDVPQAFQAQAFNALTDASQIEVLRGPQNTLFGRSASAGVITITTLAPTSTLQAGVRALATNDGEERVNGFVSGPVGDAFQFRIAVGADRYKGNLFNVFNNQWIDGHTDYNVRAKFIWKPSASWTVSLLPYWADTRSNCCTMTPSFLTAVPGGLTYGKFTSAKFAVPQALILNGIVPSSDNRQVSEDVNPEGNSTDGGAGFKIEHDIGDFTLLSVTSYDKYELHDDQDTDLTAYNWGPGGPNPVPGAVAGGSANGGLFKISSVTQEFRLTSPGDKRFRYVTGLFFSNTTGEATFVRGSNTLTQDGTLLTVPPTTSAFANYISHSSDTNYAIFGQSTFDVTSQLGLVTGLRLNRDELRYSFDDLFNKVTYGVPACETTSPSGLAIKTCSTYDSVSGKAALEYHVTPSFMLFGGYDRGNKGPAFDLTSTLTTRTPVPAGFPLAGFPVADAVASQQPVPAETVNSYELGFKSEFFDHRVILNVTGFYEIYKNFQAQSRDPNTQQNELNSIGQVTTRGVEFELFTQPIEHLSFNVAGAYDQATINSFPAAACFPSQTAALGCVNNQQNLSGAPLFNAPKFSISGNAEYDQRFGNDLTAFYTVAFRWQSGVFYSLLNDPDSWQPGYGIVNLGAGLTKDQWKVSLFVNNLLDQNYATFLGRAGNWNINPYGATKGAPISDAINWTPGRDSRRYFGVQLSYNY
jgi:iron complex outermembrane receptor protein